MEFQTFLTTVGGVFDNPQVNGQAPGSVLFSADFPGTGGGESAEFLEAADSGAFNMDGSWTVVAFVRPTFLAGATNQRGVFSKGVNTDATTLVFALSVDRTAADQGRARIFFSDGVTTVSSASTAAASIANNAWHFIQATFNAATGVLAVAVDRGTEATATSVVANAELLVAELRVGGTFGTGTNDFAGQICLIGEWPRVLTSNELDELYNGGLGALYENLGPTLTADVEAYFELDEESDGSGAVARVDSTGGPSLSDPDHIPSSSNVPS